MSRDKQIENMAEEILEEYTNCYSEVDQECLEKMLYKLASDVAEEIFAEIEEVLNMQAKIVCKTRTNYRETDEPLLSFIAMLDGRIYSLRVIEEHIAELKKKYTEEGK